VRTRTEQQMVHVNDGHLGLCLHHISCLAAMEPGTEGGGGDGE
jgi:hypothetical protein